MGLNKMMTVNRLPARTWNWLKMNEAVIASEDLVEADFALNLSDKITKRDMTADDQAVFDRIETGMGPDMDELCASLPAFVLETKEGMEDETVSILTLPTVSKKNGAVKFYIHAAKNSSMSLAILQEDEEEESGVSAFQIKVFAEENAHVTLYTAQLSGKKKTVLSDIGGELADHAKVEVIRLELGGEKVYTGVSMNLVGKESDYQMDLSYLGDNNKKLDMNYVAKHLGKKTTSRMDVNGVLSDHADKIFRGTIDFVAGCSGAKGNEKEDVLLLSEDVSNQTIPLILCAEEDVEGNHGASIGGLDDKTLFYMASRAISKEEAERLIARAGIESLAARIPVEGIMEKIERYL